MSYSNGYSNQYHIHRNPDETLAQYYLRAFQFQNADRFNIWEIIKDLPGDTLAEQLVMLYLQVYTEWSEEHIKTGKVKGAEPDLLYLMPEMNAILLSRTPPDAVQQVQRWRLEDGSVIKFVEKRCFYDGVL